MKPPNERQAVSEVADLLTDLFSSSPNPIEVKEVGASKRYDYAISIDSHRFMAEYKSSASTGSVAAAIDGLKRSVETNAVAALPLIIVPYMGQVGRQLCDRSRMSWLDLCGNANIIAPGLRILIEGRANKYRDRGRPPNVFASKSSRVARQLLLHPQRFQTQANLARQTGLGDGYVSKIVRRLEQEHYLEANETRAVRPRDPNLLLDGWQNVYDFDRHRIVKGHVPVRSGDELLRRVVKEVRREELEWAATGLSAAWLYTRFAAFRLVTIYLSSMPSRQLLKAMEFSDEPKGANLWLVLPDDEGIFHGSQSKDGIPCVSAVQTYLDLKQQPERAKDAAVELRRKLLNWGQREA
jgi:hypothetical protein